METGSEVNEVNEKLMKLMFSPAVNHHTKTVLNNDTFFKLGFCVLFLGFAQTGTVIPLYIGVRERV